MTKNHLNKFILALVLIIGVIITGDNYYYKKLDNLLTQKPNILGTSERTDEAKVVKVIDGDTIKIESGQKVRLIGIDTPESRDNECFHQEATTALKNLIDNKIVNLEKDISEVDKYDRLLRYIWVDGELINHTLVEDGFARVKKYPPDTKHHQLLLEAQQHAQENQLGIWKECY